MESERQIRVPLSNLDLTASIVTYKTDPAELSRAIRCCLESPLRVDLVVVDNSPTDQIGSVCRALGVEYIHTGSNLGFGCAHNIAMKRKSGAKYHLILNPDVQFRCDVLPELISFMEMNEAVGLVMPRVVYPDGSPQALCKRLPSPIDILAKRFFSSSPLGMFKDRLAAFELRNAENECVLSVPYLSGCFMLVRRAAIEKVGLFDERFFMYFEDLDLTRRIRQRYQTVFYPWKSIIHRHEMGSYKSAGLLLAGLRSAVQYFNKWGWVRDHERSVLNGTIGPVVKAQRPAPRCCGAGQ